MQPALTITATATSDESLPLDVSRSIISAGSHLPAPEADDPPFRAIDKAPVA
jgi:hypothetical protein